jgi:hypothetical protein
VAHELAATIYTQERKKNPAQAGFFDESTKPKYRQRIENRYFSRKPFRMNILQGDVPCKLLKISDLRAK